jgi:hypothetical protein
MTTSICAYCGSEATERDHVIPASFLGDKGYERDRYWIVDSCTTCNNLAGSTVFFSIPEKADHIKKQYEKKYKKVITMPEWEKDDLNEMSHQFKEMIFGYLVAKRVLLAKLDFLSVVASYETTYSMPDFIKNKILEWKQEQHDREAIGKLIPVFQYAKLKGVTMQTVYRWIREGKLESEKDYVVEKMEVERIRLVQK